MPQARKARSRDRRELAQGTPAQVGGVWSSTQGAIIFLTWATPEHYTAGVTQYEILVSSNATLPPTSDPDGYALDVGVCDNGEASYSLFTPTLPTHASVSNTKTSTA